MDGEKSVRTRASALQLKKIGFFRSDRQFVNNELAVFWKPVLYRGR